MTEAGETYLPALSQAFRIISEATERIAPALPSRKLRIGVSPKLRKHLPSNWPRDARELQPYVSLTTTTEDLEKVRSGQLDGILRPRRADGYGLSSEMIALVHNGGSPVEIHYIAATGLAGCRQSRALVSSLEQLFSSEA